MGLTSKDSTATGTESRRVPHPQPRSSTNCAAAAASAFCVRDLDSSGYYICMRRAASARRTERLSTTGNGRTASDTVRVPHEHPMSGRQQNREWAHGPKKAFVKACAQLSLSSLALEPAAGPLCLSLPMEVQLTLTLRRFDLSAGAGTFHQTGHFKYKGSWKDDMRHGKCARNPPATLLSAPPQRSNSEAAATGAAADAEASRGAHRASIPQGHVLLRRGRSVRGRVGAGQLPRARGVDDGGRGQVRRDVQGGAVPRKQRHDGVRQRRQVRAAPAAALHAGGCSKCCPGAMMRPP